MARKKKEQVSTVNLEDYPKFGVRFKDEDGVELVIESNNRADKGTLVFARDKKAKRPILMSVESDIFDSYKFTNFALTTSEAKELAKELLRMVDYLEN